MENSTSSLPITFVDILGKGPPYAIGNIVGHIVAQRMHKAENGHFHVPTYLCIMGAIAGFAAQMGLREELIHKQKKTERDVFNCYETVNGHYYYGGAALGALLTDTPKSVFQIIGAALQTIAGSAAITTEMAAKAVRAVASEADQDYGLTLDVSMNYQPHLKPLEALKIFWNQAYAELYTMSDLSGKVTSSGWSSEIAASIYHFILLAQSILPPPDIVFEIVMRSAISMGRINPDIIIRHIKDNRLEWSKLGRPNEKMDYPVYR